MRWFIAPLLLLGCATSLANRAREAGADPGPEIAELQRRFDAIDATKRIFAVTLIEGRRRFSGDGAVTYTASPRSLVADIFGPHDTHVVGIELYGDSLVVRLPQEGEVLVGRLGDPAFAELTGERALASPEVLGALIGAYDVAELVREADLVSASREGDRTTLFVTRDDIVHAFTRDRPSGPVITYQQERDGELVYRTAFSDFAPVDGRESPRRVVLRDFRQRRQLVFDVRSERGLGG